MPTDCITFRETGYFSKLICDYIDQDPMLEPFYNRFPSLGNLKAQMVEKQSTYAKETRAILTDSLHNQYKNVAISEATQTNLSALSKSNTFTITTGHQLNIFTGPLYFLYKIVSTITWQKSSNKSIQKIIMCRYIGWLQRIMILRRLITSP